MTYNSKRILLCIDDSESSKHAVDYVAGLARGDDRFVINVFHAVGPVPMELREFSGAENPKKRRIPGLRVAAETRRLGSDGQERGSPPD